MKHIKLYEDFLNESVLNDAKATEFETKNKISESLNEGAFDMYTPAGDKACQKLVDGIVAKINGDKKMTGPDVEKLLKDGVAKVAKTHREIHDTEPRGEIAHQITKALKAAGYSFYFDSYGHLNEGLNEGNSNDVITMNGDIDFSMQGEADPKKEIAGFEKKFKVKIKATGKSYNTATVEYEITGKKKDIIKFYVDGMEWPEEDLEDSYPELFESELNEASGVPAEVVALAHIKLYEDFLNESLVTEGQFSWMTQDTGKQIGSEKENTIAVTMFDDKGNKWLERKYDGYGEFGGKDYYELLAQMNGVENADRQDGIDIAFGKKKVKGKTLFPALVENPNRFNYKRHDFTQEADNDPNQSWYTGDREDDSEEQYDESATNEAVTDLVKYVEDASRKTFKNGGNGQNLLDSAMELASHLEGNQVGRNTRGYEEDGFYEPATLALFKKLVDSMSADDVKNNQADKYVNEDH